MTRRGVLAGVIIGVQAFMGAAAETPLTLDIQDYLALPITGKLDGTGQTDGMLARINSFREEPFDSRASGVAAGALAQDRPGTKRFFLHDLNGPLYILDSKSKALTVYLDFNGRNGRPGVFHKLAWEVGYANGLMSFQFDPDYRANGKFYTVHIEEPGVAASNLPDNTNFKGLNVAGYAVTAPIVTPGPIQREGILVEWTDTNRSNKTFEGTARELMRIQYNTRTHPLGDLAFNPAARRGDSEWRVLYAASGDGAAGESSRPDTRNNPQRLDTMVGKILRIIPDLAEHQSTSVVSDNGRYRIPNDNPYVSTAGARKEIWASGFRNPHRLHWAIDPGNPKNNRLIANSIGMRTWETVNIIQRGANYGYSLREGNEAMKFDNLTEKRPEVDRIPVQIGERMLEETITPAYPVVQYPHKPGGGDAIGSGFLYQGKNIPALRGKYVFSDISTGRLWYVDYREMLAADDGNADTMAPMHEIALRWDNPNDKPDAGTQLYPTMFPIVEAAYHFRGGKDPNLPGRATVSGEGRADAQLAVDAAGELYILTKSDGMIRTLVR